MRRANRHRDTLSLAARLWRDIRRAGQEIDAVRRHAEALGTRFAATIEPRERALTRAVCRLTERLVERHGTTSLDSGERTLLGLWINENLASLSRHPFAPPARTEALARRWRRHLGAAAHPLDVPLASLYARQSGRAGDAGPDRLDGGPHAASTATASSRNDRGRGATSRRDEPGDERPRHEGERPGEGRARGARAGGGRGADGGAAEAPARTAHTVTADLQRLVERLFRRLARVLHPDRELDETRKRDKHRLMSECLRARDERDLDALSRLYATHVGELPDELTGVDPLSLERLLRGHLATLRHRLRTWRTDDALRTMIVDRYGAADPAESERRFAGHARALEQESARVAGLERLVASLAGLREALAERRELELDRLSIDELTGLTRD